MILAWLLGSEDGSRDLLQFLHGLRTEHSHESRKRSERKWTGVLNPGLCREESPAHDKIEEHRQNASAERQKHVHHGPAPLEPTVPDVPVEGANRVHQAAESPRENHDDE